MPHELRENGFLITDDPRRLDLTVIHGYLTRSYWCPGVSREVVRRSIDHSLCLGVYEEPANGPSTQVGFGRAVTDRATFAYLSDFFILENHRGRGLAKLLMRAFIAHPELQNLRRWLLLTGDAHGFYQPFGFGPPKHPEMVMERG